MSFATEPSGTKLAAAVSLVGFGAMFLPVYWSAARTIWKTDDNAHGPIILAVILWLFWELRGPLRSAPYRPAAWTGSLLFAFGLAFYVLGRISEIAILVLASQLFVVAGALALLRGRRALRLAWFPVLYFIFMIPLPSLLIDALTGPLKQWISAIVVEGLYAIGYPIARTGVIIDIGQYQLQVADACSGLHSMFSLTALGTLYMYITARPGLMHNALMLAAILPIAFIANIMRVIVLVLITYHFGDGAGQGFLHGAAGMVLMMVALAALFLLDLGLRRIFSARPRMLGATRA